MKNIFPFLIIFFLISISSYWHIQDHNLPTGDAGAYLLESIHSYSFWQKGEVLKFFQDMYWHRPVKPIGISAIGSILLVFTKGNIQYVAKIYGLLFYLLFIVYLALLIQLISKNRLLTSLMLFTVGISPWIIASSTKFLCEIVILATMTGFVFHLLCANSFKEYRHALAAAILLAVAIIVQPAIAITSAIVPVSIIFFHSIFRTSDSNEKLKQKGNFITFLLIVLGMSLFWYAPKVPELIQWVQRCTFGDLAIEIDLRPEGSGVNFLILLFQQYLATNLVAISLCFLLLSIFGRPALKKYKNQSDKARTLILVGAILPMLVMAIFIRNGDTRYYIFPFTMLFVLLAVMLPKTRRPRELFSYLPIFALGIFYSVYNLEQAEILPFSNVSKIMPEPKCCVATVQAWGKNNISESLYKEVEAEVLEKPIVKKDKKIHIGVIATDYYLCPMQLNLIGYSLKKENIIFDWVDLFRNDESPAVLQKFISTHFDYLLVGPIAHSSAFPQKWHSLLGGILQESFINKNKTTELEKLQLVFLHSFTLQTRPKIPEGWDKFHILATK